MEALCESVSLYGERKIQHGNFRTFMRETVTATFADLTSKSSHVPENTTPTILPTAETVSIVDIQFDEEQFKTFLKQKLMEADDNTVARQSSSSRPSSLSTQSPPDYNTHRRLLVEPNPEISTDKALEDVLESFWSSTVEHTAQQSEDHERIFAVDALLSHNKSE